MIRYWSNMAAFGDPNGRSGGLPYWPAFKPPSGAYLSIDVPQPSAAVNLAPRCSVWDAYLDTLWFL